MCYTASDYCIEPFIIEMGGIACYVNEALAELSGFTADELVDKPFKYIWHDLFLINVMPDSIAEQTEAFLFTRQLEAISVVIQKESDRENNATRYILSDKTDSRLYADFPYIDYLFSNGRSGIAFFSVPDLVLLKANQAYLSFLETPYNERSNSIGRTRYTINPGFKGSWFEKMTMEIIRNGEVLEVKEQPFYGFSRGVTYWDITICPIYEGTCMKFLIQVSNDMTESTENKKLLAKKNKLIMEQKEQFEAIIENMSDSLCIFDAQGKYTIFNKSAREMYFPQYDYMNKTGDGYYQAEYYDNDGNRIPFEGIPAFRVKQGNKFTSMGMLAKYPDKELHLEVSGTPLYDSDGNFLMGILCSRDVTCIKNNEILISKQKEELLAAEIETRKTLEETINLKDEFIYLISHEMRTPSAIVSSALQAIELMYKNEVTPNVRKHLLTIKQNTNRQLRLVNNLLDITKISSGNINLNRSAIDIVFLTKAIVDSVEVYGRQKNIEVSFSSEIPKKIMLLDDEKYERILLNLLANAVKFTPKGNKISVSVSAKKKRNRNTIYISICDEGIGIPKDKMDLVFQRFGQVDSSLSRQAEGTGLGLPLVKLLIEAMGGEITLESELGIGSTFTVMLPAIRPTKTNSPTSSDNNKNQFYSDDTRIIKAASIEFSDIYYD